MLDIELTHVPLIGFRQQSLPIDDALSDFAWILLPKAYQANVRQFYVEQEPPYSMPRLESVAVSFKYLDTLVA